MRDGMVRTVGRESTNRR